jgi:hypothetical protein
MRNSIVLLCGVLFGLAFNLMAVANPRPNVRLGEPVTSPAQIEIPLV